MRIRRLENGVTNLLNWSETVRDYVMALEKRLTDAEKMMARNKAYTNIYRTAMNANLLMIRDNFATLAKKLNMPIKV
jgi:hypothetical protein